MYEEITTYQVPVRIELFAGRVATAAWTRGLNGLGLAFLRTKPGAGQAQRRADADLNDEDAQGSIHWRVETSQDGFCGAKFGRD